MAVRSFVAGFAGDGEDAFGGDSALGFFDSFDDEVGDHFVVVFAFGSRRWPFTGLVGFEFVDDAFDGFVAGVAEFGGSSIRSDFAVSGNDIHTVPRRLQWNSPGDVVCGWHLHRHRSGPEFLVDTTSTGWGLFLATSGDFDLATCGYFFMTTDSRARLASCTPSSGVCFRCPAPCVISWRRAAVLFFDSDPR